MAALIVNIALVYALVGLAFGVAFAVRGAGRVDAGAAGAPWGFKVLIVPGAAALWPWMAVKWARAARRGSAGTGEGHA